MNFQISRLNTEIGIFRLSGELEQINSTNKLNFKKAEFMGTDGWVELDLSSEHGQKICSQIETVVIEHISSNS
jgi:hypothetical protein